jgi:hypothetical protein
MNALIRLKLALTEETPTVKPYDERAWATLADVRLPVEPSLAIVEHVHLRWVTVMQAMRQDQFSRPLMHPENGPMIVDGMLALYAWHGRHHVAHVTGLRERDGI